MGYNLTSIKTIKSAEVAIKDPDGAPTGAVFIMAGPEHPARKQIVFAEQRRQQAHIKKTRQIDFIDPEENEQTKREHLAAFTLGWRGFTDEAGNERPFSVEAARALYNDPDMAWLVDQLEVAISEKERFVTRSKPG